MTGMIGLTYKDESTTNDYFNFRVKPDAYAQEDVLFADYFLVGLPARQTTSGNLP